MMHTAATQRYESMTYRRCGRSGLLLPAISLGLWHNFGNANQYESMREIICHAFDKGITHFDLANNYGPPAGEAEINFGKILREELNAYRDELIISTKAGYYMWPGPYGEWGSRKYLLSSLDQSLKRLGISYVDIFYSHRPDPNTPLEETMMALDHAVRSGKAVYAGISSYDAERTKEAALILKSLGTPCLIHQPRYSLFDRWVENKTTDEGESLLDVLSETGMGSIVFSPLAQGLLTDRYLKGIPENSRIGRGLSNGAITENVLTPQRLQQIKALNDLAVKRNQTLAQMAIAWLLNKKQVTSVLVGASSVLQLDDNIKGLSNLSFEQEELEAIERVLT